MKKIWIFGLLLQCAAADFHGLGDDELRMREDLPARVELAARQLYGESNSMDHEFILETFRKGSEAGIARAHTGLADCHLWGVGMTRDNAPILKLYELAEAGGDPLGTLRLGDNLLLGRGTPRNPQRGMELIRKASALGLKNADATLALRTLVGEGMPLDRDGGLRRLHELVENDGSAIAAFYLGRFYRGDFGQRDKNAELEHQFFQIAAAKNNAGAMVALGDMALAQEPTTNAPNPKHTAADWYRKAIRRNSGEAMFNLAKMQQRDATMRAEREDWYQLLLGADRVGFGKATQYLGELHYHAAGYYYRDLDWSKSAFFHKKYLSDGFGGGNTHSSLHRLFEIYFEGGLGLERDFEKCLQLLHPYVNYCAHASLYAGRILLHPDAPMGATREHFIRGYACLLKSAAANESSNVTEELLFVLRSRHGMTRAEVDRAEALFRSGFPNPHSSILP